MKKGFLGDPSSSLPPRSLPHSPLSLSDFISPPSSTRSGCHYKYKLKANSSGFRPLTSNDLPADLSFALQAPDSTSPYNFPIPRAVLDAIAPLQQSASAGFGGATDVSTMSALDSSAAVSDPVWNDSDSALALDGSVAVASRMKRKKVTSKVEVGENERSEKNRKMEQTIHVEALPPEKEVEIDKNIESSTVKIEVDEIPNSKPKICKTVKMEPDDGATPLEISRMDVSVGVVGLLPKEKSDNQEQPLPFCFLDDLDDEFESALIEWAEKNGY